MEYQNQGLDRLLAAYCSPALAGIKPANLVSCDRARYPDLPYRLLAYRKAFACRGMRFEILCSCGGRYLLLVYQQQRLAQRLAEPGVQRALRYFGYAEGQTMEALLCRLRYRMAASDGFPHEIGLFLGYPVEDVMGFVRYGGRGCKLSGYWKVYGDAEEAARLFERLSRVCRAVTRRVEQGETLLQVFAAS
ncbi:MAG: DUF3793 family protein [Agathobaculum desmolans]|uniref:DUF3793 family protein n=1 Tax=Agathobaculum desmolans TaxID=39484 RepID=UPI00399351FE